MNSAAVASERITEGWAPVPVRGKVPIPKAWQDLRIGLDDVPRYFKNGENVGGLLGAASGHRVDVDLDCSEGLVLADRFLPATASVFGRPSNPASHRIYLAADAPYIKLVDPTLSPDDPRATLVELRQDGHQTVLPGSIHPSGEVIAWVRNGTPATVPSDDLATAVHRIGAASLLVRYYPGNGRRNDWALALSGALLRAGWDDAEAEHFLGSVARAAHDEEAASREAQVEQTRRKLDAGSPVTGFRTLAEMLDPRVAASVSKWLGLRPDSPAVAVEAHLTDLGNARRFVAMHRDAIRYVPSWRKWLIWDGSRWRRDDLGNVHRLARETVAAMYADAAKEENDDKRRKAAGFALASESEKRLRAMVALAECEDGIAIRESELDRDAWLLNVANGTLDLRTGELRTPNPADLLTYALEVPYDAAAKCSRWMFFLARIFNADDDLGRFVQRAVGYSLTGSTREQVFLILHGRGKNGKSTFLETIRAMLGPLAQAARFESFLVKHGDGIPNDIARMRGVRLVSASESEGGKRLSEATLKDLTGGDTVSARFMRGEFFDFNPTAKIWLSTNHKPEIRGTDLAIWRRVRLVPFSVTIPEAERDLDLKDKLRDELPGVLAWAVTGCRDWQHDGLGTADAVNTSTDDYRREMDLLGDFLEERCRLGEDLRVTSGDLYAAYRKWAETGGNNPMAQRTFKLRLEERADGLTVYKATGGVRTWKGVGLA